MPCRSQRLPVHVDLRWVPIPGAMIVSAAPGRDSTGGAVWIGILRAAGVDLRRITRAGRAAIKAMQDKQGLRWFVSQPTRARVAEEVSQCIRRSAAAGAEEIVRRVVEDPRRDRQPRHELADSWSAWIGRGRSSSTGTINVFEEWRGSRNLVCC